MEGRVHLERPPARVRERGFTGRKSSSAEVCGWRSRGRPQHAVHPLCPRAHLPLNLAWNPPTDSLTVVRRKETRTAFSSEDIVCASLLLIPVPLINNTKECDCTLLSLSFKTASSQAARVPEILLTKPLRCRALAWVQSAAHPSLGVCWVLCPPGSGTWAPMPAHPLRARSPAESFAPLHAKTRGLPPMLGEPHWRPRGIKHSGSPLLG